MTDTKKQLTLDEFAKAAHEIMDQHQPTPAPAPVKVKRITREEGAKQFEACRRKFNNLNLQYTLIKQKDTERAIILAGRVEAAKQEMEVFKSLLTT